MKFSVLSDTLLDVPSDAVIVGVWQKAAGDNESTSADRFPPIIPEELLQTIADDLTGKAGDILLVHTRGLMKAPRILFAGLGKRESATAGTYRDAAGSAIRYCKDRDWNSVASVIHLSADNAFKPTAAKYAAIGAAMAAWDPGIYHKEKPGIGPAEWITLSNDTASSESAAAGAAVGSAVNFARNLSNEPANVLTPAELAERARKMAESVGLQCEILDEDDMHRHGMQGILSVAMGSENRARLIVLKHLPNDGPVELALVGKGITFDTGGISIKPTEGMGAMKGDMSGAAAVIGAMQAIAELNLAVNVIAVAPCAENMPSGKAYRPGDVIRMMNGSTVEIMTTDAEGRMVLGDAITFTARNLQAKRIVDVATLTGACGVALGPVTSGAFSNDDALCQLLLDSAAEVCERTWRMPLFPEYAELIKSEIADLKNSGGRYGGAITAAEFLRTFTDDLPWVHLDIAPTARSEGSKSVSKGPTGVMVQTLVQLTARLT